MMFIRTTRPAARYARSLRAPKPHSYCRFQSTQSTSSTQQAPGSSGALTGGLAGGTIALVLGYGWYTLSGARTAVRTVKDTQSYADSIKSTLTKNAPEPDQALNWFRDSVKSYAGFLPGGRGYVDRLFDDLDTIKQKHGGEVDSIIKDAYGEMKDLSKKKGASVDSAIQGIQILQKALNRLLDLGGDAAGDILDNHPKIKQKVGGNIDQLKEMGDAYGPKAKEEVNKTWEQITSLVKKGAGLESADEIRKLVNEKRDQLQKLGDEAWEKGMSESKQYLEKVPKVKELVESNADALKKGDFSELWGLVKESATSGKTEDVEKFVKEKAGKAKESAKDTAQSSGIDLEKWSSMVPGGSEILGQLQSIQEIGQKKGKDAEGVLKDTAGELQEVLKQRQEELEKIADEAKEEKK